MMSKPNEKNLQAGPKVKMEIKNDSWLGGNPYEKFMGRWSALVAQEFFDWLAIPPGSSWLDIGCGTGTLTRLILDRYHPKCLVVHHKLKR